MEFKVDQKFQPSKSLPTFFQLKGANSAYGMPLLRLRARKGPCGALERNLLKFD